MFVIPKSPFRHGLLRRGLLRRGLAFLAIACCAAPAFAQDSWGTQMRFMEEENFDSVEWNLSAALGESKRYWFDVPAGATQVRVEALPTEGTNSANMYIRTAPDGPLVCSTFNAGADSICNMVASGATRYYVELLAPDPFTDVTLRASYLPPFADPQNFPDRAYQVARRKTWHGDVHLSTSCMENPRKGRNTAKAALPQTDCVPVGNPQAWRFMPNGGGTFRVRNVYNLTGDACLRPLDGSLQAGALVIDAECGPAIGTDWRLLAAGGANNARHFVLLQNVDSGYCLDFADGAAKQVDCRVGAANAPGWALRDHEQRGKASPERGYALKLADGGTCMNDDEHDWFVALGDCSDPRSSHLFGSSFLIGGGEDDGMFFIAPQEGHGCVTLQADKALAIRECDLDVRGQQWSLEVINGAYRLRNADNHECLQGQGGSTAIGTRLTTTACSVDAAARWRFVAN